MGLPVVFTQWDSYPQEQSVGDFIGDWLPTAIITVILLVLLIVAIEIVSEKTALVIERLGKFNRIMYPGLRFRIPFIERVADEVSLQIQQIQEDVKVKTSDNVFVTLPVSVQYRVQEGKVREAYYELEEPQEVIVALVLNDIKSTAAGMQLDEVFTSRDQLELGVRSTLEEKLGGYGYEIINVVVDNPLLSDDLEASFNNVMAALREQDAATAQAEALKIRQIGEATANAEGLKINAEAIAAYRRTIAEGNAEAVTKMTEGTDLEGSEALRYFEVTDTNDAIRDASRNGATVVVASPTHTDGLYATLSTSRNEAVPLSGR